MNTTIEQRRTRTLFAWHPVRLSNGTWVFLRAYRVEEVSDGIELYPARYWQTVQKDEA